MTDASDQVARPAGALRITKGGSDYRISTTHPDAIIRHDISDEQLTMLQTGNRSLQHEIMWIALGTALGAVVPALSAVSALNASPQTFTYWELLECVIFFAGTVVFAVMSIILWKEPSSVDALAKAIRDRTAREDGSKDDDASAAF